MYKIQIQCTLLFFFFYCLKAPFPTTVITFNDKPMHKQNVKYYLRQRIKIEILILFLKLNEKNPCSSWSEHGSRFGTYVWASSQRLLLQCQLSIVRRQWLSLLYQTHQSPGFYLLKPQDMTVNKSTKSAILTMHMQVWTLVYQSAISVVETPTWSRMAAGWGQYKYSCCRGYCRWPSTEFEI